MRERNPEISIQFGVTAVQDKADNCEAYLEELYDAYAGPLFRYALALTSSPEDAEDAVQEVFVRVAREAKRLSKVGSIKAYLFTATRNAAYTILRGRRRKDELEKAVTAEPQVCDPVRIDGMVLDSAALQKAFLKLPVEQREVLVLKVFDGMTFKEIAKTIGASINTVAARYRYAIEKLRRALEEDNG